MMIIVIPKDFHNKDLSNSKEGSAI